MPTRADTVRIAVFQHDAEVPPGHLACVLGDAAVRVRLDRGEAVPEASGFDGIVVLGGLMGAYEEDDFPFLIEEKAMLRSAVDAGIPVLGICLGCQLLAAALGGAAYRAPTLEVRFGSCDLTDSGRDDPVLRHLAEPVLTVHQDTWDPPSGVRVIAATDAYPQAFRDGSAIGIQPHPEVTPEIVAAWIPHIGPDRMLAAGTDPGGLLRRLSTARAASAATARAIFGAWLETEVRTARR